MTGKVKWFNAEKTFEVSMRVTFKNVVIHDSQKIC